MTAYLMAKSSEFAGRDFASDPCARLGTPSLFRMPIEPASP